EDGPVKKGMPKMQIFELASRKTRQHRRRVETGSRREVGRQLFGHDVDVTSGVERNVFRFRMESDGHGSRQGPGSCGPDHGRNLPALERSIQLGRIVGQRILHPDRGAGVHLVFDFRFRQGRPEVEYEMHTSPTVWVKYVLADDP